MRKLELAGIGGLSASPQELKDHLNHLVEVPASRSRPKAPRAVAGGSEPAFDVIGIRDLAPTCGAAH